MIRAFLLLLLLQLAGTLVAQFSGVPVPGTVLGFVLLFVVLIMRQELYATLQPTAKTLLDNMALLFLPAAVGIVQQLPLLHRQGWELMTVLLLSQIIGMAAAALTMGAIIAWQRRRALARRRMACHAA